MYAKEDGDEVERQICFVIAHENRGVYQSSQNCTWRGGTYKFGYEVANGSSFGSEYRPSVRPSKGSFGIALKIWKKCLASCRVACWTWIMGSASSSWWGMGFETLGSVSMSLMKAFAGTVKLKETDTRVARTQSTSALLTGVREGSVSALVFDPRDFECGCGSQGETFTRPEENHQPTDWALTHEEHQERCECKRYFSIQYLEYIPSGREIQKLRLRDSRKKTVVIPFQIPRPVQTKQL